MTAKKRASKSQPQPTAHDEPPVLAIIGLVTALIIAPVGLVISLVVLARQPDRVAKIIAIIGVALGAFSTVIFGLIIALVVMTTSDLHTKANNVGLKHDLQSVQIDLELYFSNSSASSYPTLDELNSSAWRSKNEPSLGDPNWTVLGEYVFVTGTPQNGQMSYETTPADCQDTAASPCTAYTLSSVPLGDGLDNTVHSLGN